MPEEKNHPEGENKEDPAPPEPEGEKEMSEEQRNETVKNDRLVTYFKNEREKYLDLRFEEPEPGYFLCPNCSTLFHVPYDPDDPLGLHEDDDW